MGGTRSIFIKALTILGLLAGLGLPAWLGLETARETVRDFRAIRAERSAWRQLPETATTPEAIYDFLGFRTSDLHQPGAVVPRAYLHALPRLLPGLHDYGKRKGLFLSVLLPHVLRVNEAILSDRKTVQALRARIVSGQGLSTDEAFWLAALATRYGLDHVDIDALLRRVDAVPPSLALAQAALESGWGTSRAAQRDNAPFGQMSWSDGDGTAALARFPRLGAAVAAYIHNLNSHKAYARLREMRAAGKTSGTDLAKALDRYSERSHAYARAVRAMIRANGLDRLDSAKLTAPGAEKWSLGKPGNDETAGLP